MLLFALIHPRLASFALIVASKGLGPYFRQHFLDKTFQGLYQVNAFDLALLIIVVGGVVVFQARWLAL